MAVATETLMIRLPVHAANRLRRVAEIAHRPIDQVIAETLQSTLPPLLDDLPAEFQADLAQLEAWPNEQLREQMYAALDDEAEDRRDYLLAQKALGILTEQEIIELDTFSKTAKLLMFRKAYAALLLKWRGERIPTLTELEAAAS